jgi:nicotinamide-nucleotide amidase
MSDTNAVETTLGDTLTERSETIAVAESCTGGLVGSRISDVPGSSTYFIGGIISYMNRAKLHELAVTKESLAENGAVSDPVAREMAQHVRDQGEATWGVSTTGYAGPEGGSSDHPVGTVFIGVAYEGDEGTAPYTTVQQAHFDGQRHELKEQIATRALQAVLDEIDSVV